MYSFAGSNMNVMISDVSPDLRIAIHGVQAGGDRTHDPRAHRSMDSTETLSSLGNPVRAGTALGSVE